MKVGDTIYPLIGADKERLEFLESYALNVAKEHGRPVRLVKFTAMEVIRELKPAPRQ